jgi:hypothetical protein
VSEITNAIKDLGYPVAVSIWLMWFLSVVVTSRLQRLLEWALAVKHQLDHIEVMLQQQQLGASAGLRRREEGESDA